MRAISIPSILAWAMVLGGSAEAGAVPPPAPMMRLLGSSIGAEAARKTVLIAGDIAGCRWRSDSATAKLVAARKGIVMTAGDNINSYTAPATSRRFRDCYGPAWGRFRKRTRPVIGNHDYSTPRGRGYFAYFGGRAGPGRRGYYAFDAGAWRIYALDSNCRVGPGRRCRKGSAQYRWLRRDLRNHPSSCVMAVWHHPLFASGKPSHRGIRPFVRLLHEAGAEIIVNGHHHLYERFAPARPSGMLDEEHGIRQFIVGTGGAPLSSTRKGRLPHSRKRTNRTHGVLRLVLGSDGYTWRFIPTRRGSIRDRGSGTCHEPPA